MIQSVSTTLIASMRGLITVEGSYKEGAGLGGKMMRLVWMTLREGSPKGDDHLLRPGNDIYLHYI